MEFPTGNPETPSFSVVNANDRRYLIIPDELLGTDIMVISRLCKSITLNANESHTNSRFAGSLSNEDVIRFEKAPDGRILLRRMFENKILSGNGVYGRYKSLQVSDTLKVFQQCNTPLNNVNKFNSVIDFTDDLEGVADWLFLTNQQKDTLHLYKYIASQSHITNLKIFGNAIEIRATKTFLSNAGVSTSVNIYTTLLPLPKRQMHPREADPRVGYYTKQLNSYIGAPPKSVITKWRLEPKMEDMARYLKGELVEPQKPIIFYIDPSTPSWLVPYFIRAVNDWQKPFEKAGFKNAITARLPPGRAEDSLWSLYSARYSAIIFQADNDEENSTYSTVVDPRTGEILESHVLMFGGVFSYVQKLYFAQASPSDIRARKANFDKELLGELVQGVVSHEVGHALGFPHNMGASFPIPVTKLRKRSWVNKHGITYSIMDYTRNNYVAQPGDNIRSRKGLSKSIGEYDKWAIEWGYRYINITDPALETKWFRDYITEKNKNPIYWYGGEDSDIDPRVQEEDMGNDAMDAGKYGLLNLKYILGHWNDWNISDTIMKKMLYEELLLQFSKYISFVVQNIGGVYSNIDSSGFLVKKYVPDRIQLKAIRFLNKELFVTPGWLISPDLKTFADSICLKYIRRAQSRTLGLIINADKINNLLKMQQSGSHKNNSSINVLKELRKGIWGTMYDALPIDNNFAVLQKLYIEISERTIARTKYYKEVDATGVIDFIRNDLTELQSNIRLAIKLTKDVQSVAHLRNMDDKITSILSK